MDAPQIDPWEMEVHLTIPSLIDPVAVREFLSLVIAPGTCHELRGLPSGRSRLIHGDRLNDAVAAAQELGDSNGIYFTLNPVRPDLGNRAAKNRDILGRHLLLIDVDRRKTAGDVDLMATQEEKDQALELGGKIADWLLAEGWPSPIYVDSGNGLHLDFLLNLETDDATTNTIKFALQALARRFKIDGPTVDVSVFNLSRISKLPGSWVRKGPNTPERPWRIAKLLHHPDVLEAVTLEQLEALTHLGKIDPDEPLHADPWEMFCQAPSSKINAYVKSGVQRELGALVCAVPGERNKALNRAGFVLGQFVGAHVLDRADAERQLAAAAYGIGLGDLETRRTIASAIESGIKKPHDLPVETKGPTRNGQAATFKPSKERDATVADLAVADAGTRWLWRGWIPYGVLTLLTAEPSTGKTRLGLDITKRIVLNMTWPDGQPIDLKGRNSIVIWVPADNQHSELVDCSAAFGFPPESMILNTTIDNIYGGTELSEKAQLDDLEARIVRHNACLVIIDTITNTSDAKSQDTSDAKRQYKPLQDIAKRTGCAIICVTHLNIAGKTLGRRADEKTRVTIKMDCPDPERQPLRRKLSVELTRLCEKPPPMGITMGNMGNDYDNTPPESPAENAAVVRPSKLPSPAVQEAIGYLATALQHGPMKVHTLRTECQHRQPPIDAKQLYLAIKYLPIEEYDEEDQINRKTYKWWKLNKVVDTTNSNGPTPF